MHVDDHWDAADMGCGELVLALRQRLRAMPGQVLLLTATDPGAPEDLPAWCRMTGHQLLQAQHPRYWLQARPAAPVTPATPSA
jgi:tRNA 2-thiouridine synthesizing protein A